jgi:hypothetical protein
MINLISKIKFWFNLFRLVNRMEPKEKVDLLRFEPNDVF